MGQKHTVGSLVDDTGISIDIGKYLCVEEVLE